MAKFGEVLKCVDTDSRVTAYAWRDGLCSTAVAYYDEDRHVGWGYTMEISMADYEVIGISSEGGHGSIEFTLQK